MSWEDVDVAKLMEEDRANRPEEPKERNSGLSVAGRHFLDVLGIGALLFWLIIGFFK